MHRKYYENADECCYYIRKETKEPSEGDICPKCNRAIRIINE